VGGDVGGDEFEDFDLRGAELIAERERIGVNGGLGGAIGGRQRQRQKSQARAGWW
jgi:hypothetical protein